MTNKLSFSEAASELEAICEKMEELDDGSEQIAQLFNESQDNLKDAIDRRIKFIKYAESQILIADEMASSWDIRSRRFKNIMSSIKDNTKKMMKAYPNLPYKGNLGSFKIYKNSCPTLNMDLTFDSELYKDSHTEWFLNKEKLREDLKAGKEIKGASLEYGEHVRINLNV